MNIFQVKFLWQISIWECFKKKLKHFCDKFETFLWQIWKKSFKKIFFLKHFCDKFSIFFEFCDKWVFGCFTRIFYFWAVIPPESASIIIKKAVALLVGRFITVINFSICVADWVVVAILIINISPQNCLVLGQGTFYCFIK